MQLIQTLNPGKIARGLGLIAFYFAGQSLVTEYLLVAKLPASSSDMLVSFLDLFSVNAEQTLPTWYATILLFVSAVLLGVITAVKHQNHDPQTHYWAGLALIFLYLSIDEGAVIHELFSTPLETLFNTSGYLAFAWLILFVPLLILFALLYLRFLFHLPPRIRNLFILAGACYVGGAVIVEAISANRYSLDGGVSLPYLTIGTVEELLEMWGVVLFIYALLSYMVVEGITAVFTPIPATNQSTSPRLKHLFLVVIAFLFIGNIILISWSVSQQTTPALATDTPFYQLVSDRFEGQDVVILGINGLITDDNPVAPAIANALLTLFDDVLVITLPNSQISIAFASASLPFDADTLAQFTEQNGETNYTILNTPTLRAIAAITSTP
ncbi:MAG: hypothetical protein IAF02_08975 [Anaerolineae bacterium]|nr:hypothetical protein [Anaerolineae bacterium]